MKGKPFIKWAGGKRQLLPIIDNSLPSGLGEYITKYAEPFIGGGAVLFHLLERHCFEQVYISDLNHALIATYENIRDNHVSLMQTMNKLAQEYYNLPTMEDKKKYYLGKRNEYNLLLSTSERTVELAGLFVFLNRTGFNGMYRVNKSGAFNVPFGQHKEPLIYDSSNIERLHDLLQIVQINLGGYDESDEWIDEKTFIYADPPYRPLTTSSSFKSYTNSEFNDDTQKELASFMKKQSDKGAKIMLSNSDPKNTEPNDSFFDDLYDWATIQRVDARRNINSDATKRGKISEILVP